MGGDRAISTEPDDSNRITLSTGETIDLPVSAEGTMLGAVFGAPKRKIQELLPAMLRPIRATASGNAAVAFLSVEYQRIGDGEIEPYNEFAITLPAVHESTSTIPYLSALTRGTSGYVWYLPVTTASAKAFGVDIWGFPKVVADITHGDDATRRQTTVTIDGERFLTFTATRPPSMAMQDDGYNYTRKDGTVLRVPIKTEGEIGAWPFSNAVSISFGEHDRADPLRDLELSNRALARVFAEGEIHFYPGKQVSPQ